MKRLADRGEGPIRGYLAACANCGLVVVHAKKTGEPFHMHRWSKLCEELGKKRRKPKVPKLTPEMVRESIRKSLPAARELDEQLKRVFRLPDRDLKLD